VEKDVSAVSQSKKLLDLGANKIISADNARCHNPKKNLPLFTREGAVTFYAADIRNFEALKHIFEVEKPEIVFHLAAQRQPGLAEIKIRETVTTSLLGCKHIIQLCEEYGVEHCIFSSTGKTSRYFTTEVYAASKKFAEWQFAAISSRRRCHLRDGSLYSYVGK
jgi:FlaA1/EpsC-like NDP-sugar epimerase